MSEKQRFLPMDLVRDKNTGEERRVNSAHYYDMERGQMFSDCTRLPPGVETFPLFYADEYELVHRCEYKPYGPIRRCECGAVYTTLADTMPPRGDVVRH